MKPTWELVKELEDSHKDADRVVGECRATMIVNYGPDGKTIKALVAEPDGLLQMIVSVFHHYHNRDELFGEMEKEIKWLQNWECQTRCYFPRQGGGENKIHLITCQRLTALLAKIKEVK